MNGSMDLSRTHGSHGVRRWVGMIAAAGLAAGASAQPAPLTIKVQAEKADLVFRGVVERLEYAQAAPSGQEQSRVPHTFVTYRVDEVLRGEDPGATVTLRFIGGPSPENGLVLRASTCPRIDLGDEDVLFVEGNAERMVPLVGDKSGRFRVIGGQVYSEMGRSVLLNGKGGIDLGPQYRLAEVETTTVNGDVSTIRYEPGTRELPSDSAPVDEFLGLVRQLVMNGGPAGEFMNADPTQPFEGPDLNPAPPPATKPGELDAQPVEPAPEILPNRR